MKEHLKIEINKIYNADCIEILKKINSNIVDLVYLDPPFFTQKTHKLSNRENTKTYEFEDKYSSLNEYLSIMENVLIEIKRILKTTGSIFLHCDKNASHYLRVILDKIFGTNNFQSEIIWTYKRWSNSKKGLLNSHQVIYFYSISKEFKFKNIYKEYSPTTNIDQIFQNREKNKNGKSVYKKDENGNIIIGNEKKGVPLSDVWEIPYLNPKAKERVGYPTQKPLTLLNQILSVFTDKDDLVLDPFCGSGTTCVSAKHLERNFIGIDISIDAVILANKRLKEMIVTKSNLLLNGIEKYQTKSEKEISYLKSIDAIPVQRNSGIDGFLKEYFEGLPVPVKIQKNSESLKDAILKLEKSSSKNNYKLKILIQTKIDFFDDVSYYSKNDLIIIKSLDLQKEELFFKKKEVNFLKEKQKKVDF